VPELWVPGAAGPSLEDFVARLQKTIETFAARRGWEQAHVEVQLHDGVRFTLHSIRPEPGYGFLTLCPYPEDAEQPWPKTGEDDGQCPPQEVIVPVGSIVRITLGDIEEQASFGFAVSQPD
jgi:hypothetical protein